MSVVSEDNDAGSNRGRAETPQSVVEQNGVEENVDEKPTSPNINATYDEDSEVFTTEVADISGTKLTTPPGKRSHSGSSASPRTLNRVVSPAFSNSSSKLSPNYNPKKKVSSCKTPSPEKDDSPKSIPAEHTCTTKKDSPSNEISADAQQVSEQKGGEEQKSKDCTCWRKPLIDQIFITDVTMNLVTVTVRECYTDKGFFRKR